MVMLKRFKLILSKFKVAQYNYKRIFKFNFFSVDLILLNLLWKNGFIYGFKKIQKWCFVFFKYDLKGVGIFCSLKFINLKLSQNKLHNILKLDPYKSYCVINNQGINFFSKKKLIIQQGGIIFISL